MSRLGHGDWAQSRAQFELAAPAISQLSKPSSLAAGDMSVERECVCTVRVPSRCVLERGVPAQGQCGVRRVDCSCRRPNDAIPSGH